MEPTDKIFVLNTIPLYQKTCVQDKVRYFNREGKELPSHIWLDYYALPANCTKEFCLKALRLETAEPKLLDERNYLRAFVGRAFQKPFGLDTFDMGRIEDSLANLSFSFSIEPSMLRITGDWTDVMFVQLAIDFLWSRDLVHFCKFCSRPFMSRRRKVFCSNPHRLLFYKSANNPHKLQALRIESTKETFNYFSFKGVTL